MSKGFIVVGLLAPFLLAACEGTTTAEWPPVAPVYNESVVLDGQLVTTMASADGKHPVFEGQVKNIGKKTVHKCVVEVSCYSDWEKRYVIDIAEGFPAEGGDIPPGERAKFSAVATRCRSLDQIRSTSVRITYAEK